MRYYIDLFFQYLMKKRWLHYIVGLTASSVLYLELNKPKIPKDAIPDYVKVAKENGEFMKVFTGYMVDVFGGGTNVFAVIVLALLILYSIYAEIKINIPNKNQQKPAKYFFTGWFQKNTVNNYHMKKDE